MTIGIMAALHDEIAELIEKISQHNQSKIHHIGMRDYYVGELEGQSCVVVLARVGKVAAAATAISLIREFNVDEIIFSGIAGGIAKHVEIGDVVVADRLIQHDMDGRPIFPRYEIPLLKMSEFPVQPSLHEEVQRATRHFFEHDFSRTISAEKIAQFGLKTPAMHVGMITSGDQFINSEQEVTRLQKALPGALAVEMEGAAVAQICHEYGVPCAVLRTISDRADSNSHVDFYSFLTDVASHYSTEILLQFLRQRNKNKTAIPA